jgi:hypothetical protein
MPRPQKETPQFGQTWVDYVFSLAPAAWERKYSFNAIHLVHQSLFVIYQQLSKAASVTFVSGGGANHL